MKKHVVLLAAVLVAAGAGGGWWLVSRRDAVGQAQAYLAKGDIAGATVALRAAVSAHPDDARARLQLADLQLLTGDPVAAEREARNARRLHPADGVVVLTLARALAGQSKWKELLAELPVDSVPPGDRAALLELRGAAHLSTGALDEADSDATAAAGLAPGVAGADMLHARVALARGDMGAATAAVDRAVALDGKRLDTRLLKANLLLRAGQREDALKQLDEAVAIAPADPLVRVERAMLLVAGGQNGAARADVDVALKARGNGPVPVFLDAVLLTRAGDYKQADARLTSLGANITRMPRGQFFQALNKLALNQPEQALDAANRFHAREPDDLAGTKLLAQAMLASREPGRAVTLLGDLVRSGVKDAEVEDMLGRAYAVSGQAGAAEQSFATAASLAPSDTGVLARLAATRMALGDAGGATAALARSMDVAPDQPGTGESLVATAIAAGDTTAAAAALNRVAARTGDTEAVGNLRGMLLVATGEVDGALAQFAVTAAKFPDSIAARLNQARLLFVLGRPDEGEKLLAEITARQPDNMQAVRPLVTREIESGRFDQAASHLQAALQLHPNDPALTGTLSDLLVGAGKPADALKLTAPGTRDGGQPVPLLAARARALAADGQTAAASAIYAQILRNAPGDGGARRQFIEVLHAAGDDEAALQVVRDGLRAAPGNPALLETALRLGLARGGLAGADLVADQLAADPANMAPNAVLKGDARMLAGRPAEALTAYREEWGRAPASALAQRMAAAGTLAGKPDEVLPVLRGWVQAHADDIDATRALAQLDLAANRLPEAAGRFEAVIRQEPRDVVALNNLAWIYQQRNDPRARATALASYRLQPGADTADTLGWIDVTEGHAATGLPLLRQSDALRPGTPAVRYHLAAALHALGQREEATAVLAQLVSGPATFAEKGDAETLLARLRASN